MLKPKSIDKWTCLKVQLPCDVYYFCVIVCGKIDKTVLDQIEKIKARNFWFECSILSHFNGYAIRTTRSIAGYLSNCELFHCWAILCHDFSIDVAWLGWLALLCFWSVFVLPTCRLCSRCFDEGIDIFVCVYDWTQRPATNSLRLGRAKNNIYVRLTVSIYRYITHAYAANDV